MESLVQRPLLILTNIIAILILYLLTHKALNGGSLSKRRIALVYIICFAFCLFSFWGADWFGYLNYFVYAHSNSFANIPMEEIYLWLIKDVCNSYWEFRAIVWGSSLIFLILTIRNFRCNEGLALFFFCSIYLIYFSYARATLAMSMMFYGYSCLWRINNRRNILTIIWGLFWIVGSFFFHKSSILGIAAIVGAFFIKSIGKNSLKMVFLFFPVLVFLLMFFFSNYFSSLIDSEGTLSEYANAGATYLEINKKAIGIGAIMNWILERTPYYFLAYASYKELSKPQIKHPSFARALFSAEFALIFLATAFLFNLGVETSTIYGRLIRFAQIPSILIFTYFYENRIVTKPVRWALYIGVLNCVYTLSYSLYNSVMI